MKTLSKTPPTWYAKFADGSTLSQFNKDGIELSFKHVLEYSSALEVFTVVLEGKLYSVSLKAGMCTIDGTHIFILDPNKYPPTQLENVRVIYFINEQVDFAVNDMTQIGQTKFVHLKLGFQANFEGRNVKRYLEVYASGDFIVRET